MSGAAKRRAIEPAVAAGHPATAAAGAEILADGGSAADAAVAAALTSCVAETVMTGLLGGGHAIYWDSQTRSARNLDCFVAVPGLGADPRASELVHLEVPFGEELVHYAVGPASCGTPGVPAGLHALWSSYGRLPWARLVEPAMAAARSGVEMPTAHAACLAMLAPVMTLDAGERIYSPGGTLLQPGDRLQQPGLVHALEAIAAEGAGALYTGSVAEALLTLSDERGGLLTREDLAAYGATWSDPLRVESLGWTLATRGDLSGIPEAAAAWPSSREQDAADYTVSLVELLRGPDLHGDTTNISVADADGNACVITTSLGLGSGDFIPGFDLHLNSMLGEADLVRGALVPGARMSSMMAPTLALDPAGELELAAGAAGGTRLRTALLYATMGVLDEGLEPQAAVNRPRFHPAGDVVNAEPGVDEDALAALAERGWTVRRWPALHHYFGGVSLVSRRGAAADPRRSGLVASPRS